MTEDDEHLKSLAAACKVLIEDRRKLAAALAQHSRGRRFDSAWLHHPSLSSRR
jgi:hypothetical protein